MFKCHLFPLTQTNTFQAVLATDEESSYVLFLYEEGGIQWTTSDKSMFEMLTFTL